MIEALPGMIARAAEADPDRALVCEVDGTVHSRAGFHERRIAVLGSDGFSDAIGARSIPGWPVPVHQCCLVAMGVHLLDNLDFRALSRACAERRRYEFFFVAQPLRIANATGSPINPTALF